MLKAKGKKGAFFAVHKGKTPGIYLTWDECKEQTNGFTGAVHKKFSNRAEAEAFVRNGLGASGSTSAQVDYKGKKRAASPDSKGGPSDEDCFVVYCDGACSNNQDKDKAAAGSGVWWGHNDSRNWSGRVPGDQTNNRGEFLAVLHILENEPIGTKPLKIKTDSKYVIDSLTKWFQGWSNNNWKTSSGKPVANAGIVKITAAHLQRRNKLGQKVHFEHVKGHAGIEGNEAADRLAVAACTLPVPIERDWDTEASRLEKENAIPLKGKLDIEVYDEDNDLASEPVTGDNDTLKPSSTRNIAEGSPAKRRRVEAPTTPSVSLLSPIKHPSLSSRQLHHKVEVVPSPGELEDYADCLLDDSDSELEDLASEPSAWKQPQPRTPEKPRASSVSTDIVYTPGKVGGIVIPELTREDLDAYADGWDDDIGELSD